MTLQYDLERRQHVAAAPVAALTTLDDRTIVVSDPGAVPGAPADVPSAVLALDERLVVVARSTVGHRASNITADPGRGRLYVVNAGAGSESVSLLDINLLATIAQRPLGPGLEEVGVDGFAGLAYVSNSVARRLHVLHADDLRVVDEVGDDTFTGPRGLAVDESLQRVYVARYGGREDPDVHALSVVQRRTMGGHNVDRTIALGPGTQPTKVAVDPAAGLVYVLCAGSRGVPAQLVVLDRQTLEERGRVGLGAGPTALGARDGHAFVSVAEGVQIVDGHALSAVGLVRIPRPRFVATDGPGRVVAAAVDGVVVHVRGSHEPEADARC
jgi:DNA-binding beta-propeller fold protein YncE